MSDNQWPFGDRSDRSERSGTEPSGDVPAGPEEDDTRAEDQGWGWVEDESDAPEAQEVPKPEKRTMRGRFRRWRRSRPFWGAFIMLLGGLFVALPPLAAYKIILVAPSVGIATGVGWVIVILAIVSFMTPSQNKLYGLLAILAGGIAVVASNLGGFLIGTILTVLGGALTFAWTPLPPDEQPEVVGESERRVPPEGETAQLEETGTTGEHRETPPEDVDAPDEDEPRTRDDGLTERSWVETR